MTYLRSFLVNFLFVFFINRVAPGIEVVYFDQYPDLGADLLFSVIVGFLNASVFPFYNLMEIKISMPKIAIPTFLFSYLAFAFIWAVPFGVEILSPAGFFVGGTVVWLVALFSNYLEWKHDRPY